jgi:hypothetical protein
MTWQAEADSYWPFESKEEAFEFLDQEFGAPLTGNISCEDVDESEKKPMYLHRS